MMYENFYKGDKVTIIGDDSGKVYQVEQVSQTMDIRSYKVDGRWYSECELKHV